MVIKTLLSADKGKAMKNKQFHDLHYEESFMIIYLN